MVPVPPTEHVIVTSPTQSALIAGGVPGPVYVNDNVTVDPSSPTQPVPYTLIVPTDVVPEYLENVSVPASACTLGVEMKEIETNNAEASKSTRYKEITGRLLNFRHAPTVSPVRTI
jgi:hypothetical protein